MTLEEALGLKNGPSGTPAPTGKDTERRGDAPWGEAAAASGRPTVDGPAGSMPAGVFRGQPPQAALGPRCPAPTEGLMAMALADIPHVGKFCGHAYPGGKGGTLYCKLEGQICCHQVHDICPDWDWRGFGGDSA